MGATLGQVIRERRMDLGLTQEELAERIGVTVRQAEVSRLERNRIALPRRGRLERIAAALELTLGELLVASGWAGVVDLDRDTSQLPSVPSPSTALARPDHSPPTHLSDAMERAEILILRSELAVAMAQDTAWRVDAALQRRKNGLPAEMAVTERSMPPPGTSHQSLASSRQKAR